ncbi:MAG: hypothetical protein QM673_09065 [Gordonia sp. (in: high G+C Gram-positive bacteria)]
MSGLFVWWDSVEEWLTGLSFVPQIFVSIIVIAPLAIGVAIVLNVLVDALVRLVDRRRVAERDGKGL